METTLIVPLGGRSHTVSPITALVPVTSHTGYYSVDISWETTHMEHTADDLPLYDLWSSHRFQALRELVVDPLYEDTSDVVVDGEKFPGRVVDMLEDRGGKGSGVH